VPSRAFRFGEGSFAVPYNTRMEPSRSTVLCDHVAEARGSFAALGGRLHEISKELLPINLLTNLITPWE
jgi:hypothetical protein